MCIRDSPDVFTCDYYVLDTITGAHLSGNEYYEVGTDSLNAGDTIFTTSTVFVYADTLGCGDTISFEVNITPAPILDPIADVEVCDMYVLEPITGQFLTGNEAYYSSTGDTLNAGDIITMTDSLTVIASAGECADTIDFVVTIIPSVALDSIPDVFTCDYYVLDTITGAHLSGNEEYEVNGTILAAGDTIFTTSTVFVYADTLGCGDTISFEVNITCLLYTSDAADE